MSQPIPPYRPQLVPAREITADLGKDEILGLLEDCRENGEIFKAKQIKEELYTKVGRVDKMGPMVECLRWAERTLGVLVRRGQRGPDAFISTNNVGKPSEWPKNLTHKSMDFFISIQERGAALAFTDGVSDEQFADAIAVCKAQGSMSRAAVARAVAARPPAWTNRSANDRPEHMYKKRRLDAERVLEQSIAQIASVFEGIDAVLDREHFQSLPSEKATQYGIELTDLTGRIRSLRKAIQRGQVSGGSGS